MVAGRLIRHLGHHIRRWLTTALGVEIIVLVVVSILAGAGVVDYRSDAKLILIAGLAMAFGIQNVTARQFGIQELTARY